MVQATHDWSVTHVGGQVMTRAQALDACRTGPRLTLEVDQLDVRCYGDTAVVTGRTVATVLGEAPQDVTLRFTDVFIRRAERWIAIASHATLVSE